MSIISLFHDLGDMENLVSKYIFVGWADPWLGIYRDPHLKTRGMV
jgi:hypothetical protein